jgi:hypothetical protein
MKSRLPVSGSDLAQAMMSPDGAKIMRADVVVICHNGQAASPGLPHGCGIMGAHAQILEAACWAGKRKSGR